MPKRTRDYDAWLFQQLTDPKVATNYINAAIQDSTEMLLVALRNVAEAHKMAKVAEKAGIAREAIYKTLSEEGNPRLETLRGVLSAMGLRIAVATVDADPLSFEETPQRQVPAIINKSRVSKHSSKKPVQATTELKNTIIRLPRNAPINGWLYGARHTIIGTIPADFRMGRKINEDQIVTTFKQQVPNLYH